MLANALSTASARLARAWVLSALIHRPLRRGWTARAARLAAVLITTGYGVAIIVDWTSSSGRSSGQLVVAAFGWLLGAAVLAALAAARDLEPLERANGLRLLWLQRGYAKMEVQSARWLARLRLVARPLLSPAIVLCTLALAASDSAGVILHRILLFVHVVIAAGAVALVLAILSRWSLALSSRRARLVLIAFVVGPYLASAAFSDVPTLQSAADVLLRELSRYAGAPL